MLLDVGKNGTIGAETTKIMLKSLHQIATVFGEREGRMLEIRNVRSKT